jgi:hypothetical protein
MFVALENQPKTVVTDPQIAIAALQDGAWYDFADFLRDHADVDFVTAGVGEAIEAEAVVEMTEQHDVVLEADVRAAPTATTAAATTATTSSTRPTHPCAAA